jgi:hypothetical protein
VTMLLTRISTIGTSTSSLPAGAAATGSTLLNNILIHGLSKPACKRALDRRSPFGRMVQNQCESCGSRPHPLAGRHSYSHTATPSSSLAAAKPTDDPVRSMCVVRSSNLMAPPVSVHRRWHACHRGRLILSNHSKKTVVTIPT